MNLILYGIYYILIKIFNCSQLYEKSFIIKFYEDKSYNPILVNVIRIFLIIFQIIIICYTIFLIPQFFLKYVLYIINLILFIIYNLLVNIFRINRFYEKSLITDIYDDKTSILANIKGILVIIFQIIIISYIIFLIPQLFLRDILNIMNLILFKIYDFLVNTFVVKKFYEKSLINKIYDDKTYNPILVNIVGLFIIIFQIIIISYTIFLIPQVIAIKCLACNFNIKSSDTPFENRIQKYSLIVVLLQLIYGFIYLIIKYTICILPSLYYIFYDLDLKSKNSINVAIKDLSNIIYNSKLFEFTQIFFGKFYLNIIFYYLNKLTISHIIFDLSKTTDIIFVKILENIFTEFYKIPFIPTYFPFRYLLKYIGIAFKCISIKTNKNTSKFLDLVLNIFSLVICSIPFYLLYVCFENDSKKIIFIELPIVIYFVFNIWICGRAIKDIEEHYGAF